MGFRVLLLQQQASRLTCPMFRAGRERSVCLAGGMDRFRHLRVENR